MRARHLILLCAGAIACGASGLQQTPAPRFDGARAFAHVREQVAIGPRPAGSAGAQRTRAYITAHLKSLGISTEEQAFEAQTPIGKIRMVNLRATLPGTSGTTGPRLIIASHYDTKLFKEVPFVGANDGGSSTAVLLELATALKDRKFALPIELLFFDGEEAVIEWKDEDHTYGSRYYVDAARKSGGLKDIRALVLVDMVGDRDLRIQREPGSTDVADGHDLGRGEAHRPQGVRGRSLRGGGRPRAVPARRRAGGRPHRPRLSGLAHRR